MCIQIYSTQQDLTSYSRCLEAHERLTGNPSINSVAEMTDESAHLYPHYGDLHSYLKTKKRLSEQEAGSLFRQISQIVGDCHEQGIILRDIKLSKFVFSDEEKTQLKLNSNSTT